MFIADADISDQSKKQYRKVLARFYLYVQSIGINCHDVELKHIVSFKASINKQNLYTSNAYMSVVKVFYKWLETNNYATDIAKHVKKNKGFYGFTKKCLTVQQVSNLLSIIDCSTITGKRTSSIVRLMITTGVRTCEIARANIGDMQKVGDTYVLYIQRKGKKNKDDFVPLTPTVYDSINQYLATRALLNNASPLFANARIGSIESPITTRCITGDIKRAFNKAGITDNKTTTHSLRHTFATWLVKNGVSIYDVMAALGHSTVKSTEIYLKMAKQDMKLDNKTGKAIENILSNATLC